MWQLIDDRRNTGVMTQPPPSWNPGRAAGNTVVVLVTLVLVLCVLPAFVCVGCGMFGQLTN
jgi:hypothetical protein